LHIKIQSSFCLPAGVHHVDIYNTDKDTVEALQQLKADDEKARQIAETGTNFAKDYLVKDVMMVSAQCVVLCPRYSRQECDVCGYLVAYALLKSAL